MLSYSFLPSIFEFKFSASLPTLLPFTVVFYLPCHYFGLAILAGVKWYLMTVYILVSLLVNGVKCITMCLEAGDCFHFLLRYLLSEDFQIQMQF